MEQLKELASIDKEMAKAFRRGELVSRLTDLLWANPENLKERYKSGELDDTTSACLEMASDWLSGYITQESLDNMQSFIMDNGTIELIKIQRLLELFNEIERKAYGS